MKRIQQFHSKTKEFLVISFLPPPAISPVLESWFPLNEKWISISLSRYYVQQTVLFCPPPPLSLVGRKWVVGAESSHTEISVIVRLRVTRTPQWQQLLINPTSQLQAPPCPLAASPQNFLPLTSFSSCVFFFFFFFFMVWRWRGVSNGSFPNCRIVVCITCVAIILLSLCHTFGSGRRPTNCPRVFKLWLAATLTVSLRV